MGLISSEFCRRRFLRAKERERETKNESERRCARRTATMEEGGDADEEEENGRRFAGDDISVASKKSNTSLSSRVR